VVRYHPTSFSEGLREAAENLRTSGLQAGIRVRDHLYTKICEPEPVKSHISCAPVSDGKCDF
jgi:hypothetical protein